MASLECLIVRAVLEQREVRLARLPRSGFLRFRDALLEARDVDDLCLVRERRTHGDEVIAVVDLDDMFIVELQRLDEALAQLRQEVQRAAEEGDVAAYRPALREVANGLIDDRLENRQRNIRLFGTVVHERLDIRLGEDAAARGNRVDLLAFGREVVEPLGIGRQERGHVIDERARAAGADAVHALLRRIAEVRDLRILAAELDDGIRLRDELFDRCGTGDDLLYEGQANALSDAHAGRTRQGKRELLLADDGFQMRQILLQGIADLREMARIILVEDLLLMVENDELDGRRTDINPHIQYRFHIHTT